MSIAIESSQSVPEQAEFEHYRAVSRTAILGAVIASLAFVLMALSAYASVTQSGDEATALAASFLGLCAAAIGLISVLTIRKYPTEYTGGRMAYCATIAGILLCLGGGALYAHTIATEVPPGYIRTGFWELQPDPDRPELPVSPKSLELSGQKVFIKGYIHPGVASSGKVDRFILVPDMGTCCFGGDPKATDMIEVHIPDPAHRLAYARRMVKLAGEFEVSQIASQKLKMKNPVWYHLEVGEAQ